MLRLYLDSNGFLWNVLRRWAQAQRAGDAHWRAGTSSQGTFNSRRT